MNIGPRSIRLVVECEVFLVLLLCQIRVVDPRPRAILYEVIPRHELGKVLVIGGGLIMLAGLFVWTGVGKSWLGRLPGDIRYTRGDFSFYFPIVTCVVVSIVLTLLMWLLRRP
jgi:hypothetical protein